MMIMMLITMTMRMMMIMITKTPYELIDSSAAQTKETFS